MLCWGVSAPGDATFSAPDTEWAFESPQLRSNVSETQTPAGYTGAEVLDEIKATGREPAEISQAKDIAHEVLDSWEHNRGLTFDEGDGIELADEILTRLLAAGVVSPTSRSQVRRAASSTTSPRQGSPRTSSA